MPLFNKLSGIAKNLGDKASEALEVNRLNGRINAEKNAVNECMRKIGEFFYARFEAGESCDPGISELLAEIAEHNNVVSQTQAEIARIQAESAQSQAARSAVSESVPAAPAPTLAQDPVMAAATVACPSCGAQLPADAKFCRECGAKIEVPEVKENICPECGAVIPTGGKFCGDCGAKIE